MFAYNPLTYPNQRCALHPLTKNMKKMHPKVTLRNDCFELNRKEYNKQRDTLVHTIIHNTSDSSNFSAFTQLEPNPTPKQSLLSVNHQHVILYPVTQNLQLDTNQTCFVTLYVFLQSNSMLKQQKVF